MTLTPMTLNEYTERAVLPYAYPEHHRVIYPAMGLAGETGEVCDKIKKAMRSGIEIHTHARRSTDLALELGDVLWNLAALARDLGYSLETIAQMNIRKLHDRQARNTINGTGDHR